MFPRMHIDINMTAGSQYLAPDAHHSPESVQHMGSGTTLPDGSCSGGPPPTAAYQHHDMTPYSAVSSHLTSWILCCFGSAPCSDCWSWVRKFLYPALSITGPA